MINFLLNDQDGWITSQTRIYVENLEYLAPLSFLTVLYYFETDLMAIYVAFHYYLFCPLSLQYLEVTIVGMENDDHHPMTWVWPKSSTSYTSHARVRRHMRVIECEILDLTNWGRFHSIHIQSRLSECRHLGTCTQTRIFESRSKYSDVHLIITRVHSMGEGDAVTR